MSVMATEQVVSGVRWWGGQPSTRRRRHRGMGQLIFRLSAVLHVKGGSEHTQLVALRMEPYRCAEPRRRRHAPARRRHRAVPVGRRDAERRRATVLLRLLRLRLLVPAGRPLVVMRRAEVGQRVVVRLPALRRRVVHALLVRLRCDAGRRDRVVVRERAGGVAAPARRRRLVDGAEPAEAAEVVLRPVRRLELVPVGRAVLLLLGRLERDAVVVLQRCLGEAHLVARRQALEARHARRPAAHAKWVKRRLGHGRLPGRPLAHDGAEPREAVDRGEPLRLLDRVRHDLVHALRGLRREVVAKVARVLHAHLLGLAAPLERVAMVVTLHFVLGDAVADDAAVLPRLRLRRRDDVAVASRPRDVGRAERLDFRRLRGLVGHRFRKDELLCLELLRLSLHDGIPHDAGAEVGVGLHDLHGDAAARLVFVTGQHGHVCVGLGWSVDANTKLGESVEEQIDSVHAVG
mmetsp:Transcript_4174/g.13282  ORF Transcript_4174/g.13282 Transcript_4174/m.13282 type:complete len:461 (-) Transcript_4174:82-1464(-)